MTKDLEAQTKQKQHQTLFIYCTTCPHIMPPFNNQSKFQPKSSYNGTKSKHSIPGR